VQATALFYPKAAPFMLKTKLLAYEEKRYVDSARVASVSPCCSGSDLLSSALRAVEGKSSQGLWQ
jgi:hypothetical protein